VDGDGDALTLGAAFTTDAGGELTIVSDGSYTYTPPTFNDVPPAGLTEVFTYTITDDDGDTDQATLTITVADDIRPPIANDDSYSGPENTDITGNVVDNDDFTDGPGTEITLVEDVTVGSLTLNTDGTFTYSPPDYYVGVDTFVYSYCDLGTPNLCDTATVELNITPRYVRLELRVLLGGALKGSVSDTLMRDDLRQQGLIPDEEPYSAFPDFTHTIGGGEVVANPAAVYADNGENSIVDWVFIELRDGTDSTIVLATRSALIQRDGDVVDVDGLSPVLFGQTVAGSYFVSVRHRNHLGIMTADPVNLIAGCCSSLNFAIRMAEESYDTAPIDLFNRTASYDGAETEGVSSRIRATWLGDARGDGGTAYAGQDNDATAVFNNSVGASSNIFGLQNYTHSGYFRADVDMDGRVVFSGQSNDVDFIFDVINLHPVNALDLQTFEAIEQLPADNE
jgi:VCBS repeat-containing protein